VPVGLAITWRTERSFIHATNNTGFYRPAGTQAETTEDSGSTDMKEIVWNRRGKKLGLQNRKHFIRYTVPHLLFKQTLLLQQMIFHGNHKYSSSKGLFGCYMHECNLYSKPNTPYIQLSHNNNFQLPARTHAHTHTQPLSTETVRWERKGKRKNLVENIKGPATQNAVCRSGLRSLSAAECYILSRLF